MAWIVSWSLPIIIGVSVFYIPLFPTGRLPSRRWRWLAWLTVAFVLVGVISSAFSSGALMGTLGPIRNPLGIEGFTNVYRAVLYTISPVLLGAAALAVFVRLRRAIGVERQQIKWFVYAAAASVIGTNLAYLIPGVIDTPHWFERVGFAVNIATIPAIPISIGIAILRYRLYEIDLIINRTLVYGLLTAMAALSLLRRRGSNPRDLPHHNWSRAAAPTSRCSLHPGDRSAFQPPPSAHPVLHRQALLQKEVRR
jgi:uncharacterized membrane protein YhdT